MNSDASPARANRLLGYCALAHAASVFGLGFLVFSASGPENNWKRICWVVAVLLWFVWPLVLAFHRGRSRRRFAIFVLVGLVALFPSLWVCNRLAADVFGFPDGVSLNPVTDWQYFRAYLAGRAEARRDLAAGIFAIETFGLGASGGEASRLLREWYQVETRPIAGCFVDETIFGHAAGYNSISEPEIDRRIGHDKIEAAREEGRRIAQAQYEAAERRRKDLAKRFSIFPNDSRIRLESVSPYIRDGLDLPAAVENDLGDFVRAVEQFVMQRIPEDSPAFELHISANLARSSPPKYQISASLSAPRPVYDSIYKEIDSLPFREWNNEDSAVSLDFAIGKQAN